MYRFHVSFTAIWGELKKILLTNLYIYKTNSNS